MADAEPSLWDSLEYELDVSTTLVEAGALTNGEVLQDLTRASDFLTSESPATADEAQLRAVIRADLQGETEILRRLDYNAPADAAQWPRQRRAIERAYDQSDANSTFTRAAAAEAKAKADLLNNGLEAAKKAAGDAGKGLFDGLEGVLEIVVVLVVILVIATVAGKART